MLKKNSSYYFDAENETTNTAMQKHHFQTPFIIII